MDESKIDTQQPAWISSRNRIEAHEDISFRNPRFSTIERFLVCGGGAPFAMYDRIMELIFPKDSKNVANIMNDLNNKAITNLKAITTISSLNRIWDKTYKGASNLMNGSMNLHSIVEFPVSMDELLYQGENRVFNFFESMYPLNIRKDAENGLFSAFQFWNLPKTRKRFDELLNDFLFRYKDFSNNPDLLMTQLVLVL